MWRVRPGHPLGAQRHLTLGQAQALNMIDEELLKREATFGPMKFPGWIEESGSFVYLVRGGVVAVPSRRADWSAGIPRDTRGESKGLRRDDDFNAPTELGSQRALSGRERGSGDHQGAVDDSKASAVRAGQHDSDRWAHEGECILQNVCSGLLPGGDKPSDARQGGLSGAPVQVRRD